MNLNIYNKTISFFSVAYQEKLISKLETEFYETLKIVKHKNLPLSHRKNKLNTIMNKIDNYRENCYFNPELDTYLISLKNFIKSYIVNFKEN